MVSQYIENAKVVMRGKLNGGLLYLLPESAVKLAGLLPMMLIWKVISEQNADVGMTLTQLLGYTYMSVLLGDMLSVETLASSWCYDGAVLNLSIRPMSIFGQLISHTVGGWLPNLLFFSLPMLCAAPLLGVNVIPATAWFFPSLLLCIALGFAIDFIFVSITIHFRSIWWLAHCIRMSVMALFTGTVIPFRLLPFGLEDFFMLQPFGSLGGAPLALFTGNVEPLPVIGLQLFWNAVLWPFAAIWFHRSRERMVSFGG